MLACLTNNKICDIFLDMNTNYTNPDVDFWAEELEAGPQVRIIKGEGVAPVDFWAESDKIASSTLESTQEIRQNFVTHFRTPESPSELKMFYLKNSRKIAAGVFVTLFSMVGFVGSAAWITENDIVKTEQRQVPSATIQRDSKVDRIDPNNRN